MSGVSICFIMSERTPYFILTKCNKMVITYLIDNPLPYN